MPSKVLIKELSKLFQISTQIHNLIFLTEHENLINKSFIKRPQKLPLSSISEFEDLLKVVQQCPSQHVLQQFNILKRIINNNSIQNQISDSISHSENQNSKAQHLNNWSRRTSKNLSKYLDIQRKNKIHSVFYIEEFLDMLDEINNCQIFRKMINLNTFAPLGIHAFTRKGYKSKLRNYEYIHNQNLELMKLRNEFKIPDNEVLEMINAKRNYNALRELHSAS